MCQHSKALDRLSAALQELPEASRKALQMYRFAGCTLAVSQSLASKRKLNLKQVQALANRFGVRAETFLG